MSCHRGIPRCEYDYTVGHPMPSCCRDHLIQVLQYVTELFKEKNITHWLSYGTLLGAVRNGHIIPWDSDVDLGVLAEQKKEIEALRRRIEADGYHFKIYNEHLYQIAYSPWNLSYVDLWFFEKALAHEHEVMPRSEFKLFVPQDGPLSDDDPILRHFSWWIQVDHTLDFPYWFVDQLWTVPIEGKLMPCPKFPEKVCQLTYGDLWETPYYKSGSGYCGNCQPLSWWLDFVHEKQNHDYSQRFKYQNFKETSYCRLDTPACILPNSCCREHIKEMLSYLAWVLEYNDIKFKSENQQILVDPKDYWRTMSLAYVIKEEVKYELDGWSRDFATLYFSNKNRNNVKIKFVPLS